MGEGISHANVVQVHPRARFSALVYTDRLFLLDEVILNGQYVDALRSVRHSLTAQHRLVRVVDAGANVGLFGLFAQMTLGVPIHLIGFEPLDENCQLCEQNWREFSYELRREALSDKSGSAVLHLVSTTGATIEPAEAAAWANARRRPLPPTRDVVTMSLDEMNIETVDVLKLDIEGSEASALIGATETIRRAKPTILCSYEHFTNNASRLMRIVGELARYSVTNDKSNRLLLFVPE